MAENDKVDQELFRQKEQTSDMEDDYLERMVKAFNLDKKHAEEIARLKAGYDKKQRKDDHEERLRNLKERYQYEHEAADKINKAIAKTTSTLVSALDGTIKNYVAQQEAINAHLIGTNSTFSDVSDTLNSVLGSTAIVKQENVYSNLSNLVKSGIVYNVEQRAFLQTLSNDLGMIFNASDGTLTRMIRLLGEDISANQMSLEYSLQEFLNQNYQTSEYIKQSFTDVANQLIEAQSLMSASDALTFSGTIQSWLGSYYSAGASSSTVSSLAKALNDLSTGDVSNLGQGISNLVLMGVARAGLDYGSLLNNNLSGDQIDAIMVGISTYLQEQAGNSNVVMSQLSKLFGVNVSDIIAATNLKATTGSVTSDISALNGIEDLVTTGQLLQNRYDNFMYTWGTNIASSDLGYTSYMLEGLISKSGLGDMIYNKGLGLAANINPYIAAAGSLMTTLGTAVNNAQLLTILPTLFGTLGDAKLFSGGFTGNNDIASILSGLGSATTLGSTVKISSAGVSGGMYVGNGSTTDLLGGLNSSMNDTLGALGVSGDTQETEDHIETIDTNVQAIRTEVETLRSLVQDIIDFGVLQR